jgi:hypothetical protein
VTRNLGRLLLTPDQAAQVKSKLLDSSTKAVLVEGNLIMVSDIQGVVNGSQLRDADRVKGGDWKCQKHGNWIPRGNKCGYCGG